MRRITWATTIILVCLALPVVTAVAWRADLDGPPVVDLRRVGTLPWADVQPALHSATERILPRQDNEDYTWVNPTPHWDSDNTSCGKCHGEIYAEWRTGGHSRSATGRRFRDLYDGGRGGWSLLKDHPDGGDVCASCHAPTGESTKEFGFDPRTKRNQPTEELASVHCDYCHKIVGPAEGQIGLTHGRYGLKRLRPERGQLFFGPLRDSTRDENAYSPFQKDSRLCASCHEGTVFGVRVYSTYSEWQASPAARAGVQCQDCHMKPTGKMTNVAPEQGGVERDPATLANHRFFDGSREDMLKKCLKVNVSPARDADGVRVSVEVIADNVGHRVPTGFVDRNVVLLIEATDTAGKSVPHRDGPTVPRTSTAGRLYAKQLKDFDGHSPAPFWRADPDLTDTRLTPGEPDRAAWRFPSAAAAVRVKLLHRRFWPEVAAAKGWTDNETVIWEREFKLP
jgi:nitrate/TMAO reductase-like tetraheme cytochrome c subunit